MDQLSQPAPAERVTTSQKRFLVYGLTTKGIEKRIPKFLASTYEEFKTKLECGAESVHVVITNDHIVRRSDTETPLHVPQQEPSLGQIGSPKPGK